MTKPRYQNGCAAGSKVPGDASSSDYAWIVNFNNGNSNNYHRNNKCRVRACRRVRSPSEYQREAASVSLRSLHRAWLNARRHKQPSENQLAFEAQWIDGLIELQATLRAGTWTPAPATCFIATRPKAREIHAPDFRDRVVHHWLVPQLETIYEPTFIHDSYSNRVGKGTHAAVERLKQYARQVTSGQGGGWYLQLDVANFFNSIHRPTLYKMLKTRLARAGVSEPVSRAVHALLRYPVQRQGIIYRSTPAQRAQVPVHKRLENAGAGRGLPIGNLSSQFFANVYLDRFDQFVKHTLKAKCYLRYVDDFVLVHRDRTVLEGWLHEIERFLADELKLKLKDDIRLRPLSSGIDFLGYIIYPTHTRVRRRVVQHANDALNAWSRDHIQRGSAVGTPEDYRRLTSIWNSYRGHMRHASAWRLQQSIQRRYPWLETLTLHRRFSHRLEGKTIRIRAKRKRP